VASAGAARLLELANDLEAGRLPLPRCPAEELALHLVSYVLNS
jgi:hypothetical protein